MTQNLEPYIMYELQIDSLVLKLGNGTELSFPQTLSNGRANYILFEELVRNITALKKTTQSDHAGLEGKTYEQKAYHDHEKYPGDSKDWFQTSASSTFGANNNGKNGVDRLLKEGDYKGALAICRETGYDKNDFYIYTNTRGFAVDIPLRYFVVPKTVVLGSLSPIDPRLISRQELLSQIKEKKVL